MEMYAHREDCSVERNLEEYPGLAVLMDCDGNALLIVPDTWEDHQLFISLDFANIAYRCGKKAGQNEKVTEIKRILEIR